MIHHPSGARGESREERSQLQNKRAAFVRMARSPTFQLWLRIETGRIALLDSNVVIPAEHVRIETRVADRWVETPANQLT